MKNRNTKRGPFKCDICKNEIEDIRKRIVQAEPNGKTTYFCVKCYFEPKKNL